MKPVTAVIFDVGSRGSAYASYAKVHPEELQIITVAEPGADRRKILADELNISEANRFVSWQELLG